MQQVNKRVIARHTRARISTILGVATFLIVLATGYLPIVVMTLLNTPAFAITALLPLVIPVINATYAADSDLPVLDFALQLVYYALWASASLISQVGGDAVSALAQIAYYLGGLVLLLVVAIAVIRIVKRTRRS